MAKLKVFSAAAEGVRLIRREPKAVLVWGLLMFAVVGVPVILMMRGMSPLMIHAAEVSADGSAQTSAFRLQMFGIMPWLWIGSVLAYTLVVGAVFRAILTPDDRKYFYLRLSKAELWMVLSAVVGVIVFYIGLMIAVVVVGIALAIPLTLLSAQTGGAMSGVHWAIVLAVIVGYGAGIYAMLRFSMAPLMSFDERRFRLFEAWPFTRGEGWRLLGLALVVMIAVFLLECLFLVVFFAGFGSSLLGMVSDPAGSEQYAQQFAMKIVSLYASPWVWLCGLIGAVLGGPYMALTCAPWARAYRMLKGEPTPPAAAAGAEPDPVA